MKKTLMTLLMIMMTAVIKAQIWEGGYWYNGTLCYTAKNMAGGKVLMNAMAEGEEHEFVLVPVAGKKDVYTVANGENDYVNVYSDIATVRHQKKALRILIQTACIGKSHRIGKDIFQRSLSMRILPRTSYAVRFVDATTVLVCLPARRLPPSLISSCPETRIPGTAGLPSTVTFPASIMRSASLREQMPQDAMNWLSRISALFLSISCTAPRSCGALRSSQCSRCAL